MALRTLGLSSTTAIQTALRFGQADLDADIGAVNQQVSSDKYAKQSQAGGYIALGGPEGVIATGTLASGSPTITGLTYVAGAPLTAIQAALNSGIGLQVIAQNIPAPAYLLSISGTTIVVSQNASTLGSTYLLIVPGTSAGATLEEGAISRNARLFIPGRGVLNVARGDVIAVDNTGWPILVSGAAVDYQGSIWTLTPNTQV